MKCDRCPNDAAYHLTDVVHGQPATRHLCLSCGRDEIPPIPDMPPEGIAASKLSPEILRCSQCSAPTAVIVFSQLDSDPLGTVKHFRSRQALCPTCAAAAGLQYRTAPADHVAVVIQA